MKNTQKIVALVLVLVLAMALSVTGFAASITVQSKAPAGSTADVTYTYYEVMKADIAGDAVAYYVETKALADALTDTGMFNVTKVAGVDRWNVELKGTASGEALAKALNVAAVKDAAIAHDTFKANQKVDGLEDGYYLIVASNGVNLVARTLGDVVVTEKNDYPTVVKTPAVQNAEIGQTVNFTVTVSVPASVAEKPIKVVDTISAGLTLNPSVNDGAYTWTAVAGQTGVYSLEIPAAVVAANAGKDIVLTYSAVVNENAVVNVPETNKARVEYDAYVSVESEVQVFTFGFTLEKVDAKDNSVKLKDVVFKLTNAAGEYYTAGAADRFGAKEATVATDANGNIVFAGLAAGQYTLTEVSNPNKGYNLLTDPLVITVNADGSISYNNSAVKDNVLVVENSKGSMLPTTGGVGTTIFYVVGLVLVLTAGVTLVARRRTDAD